ncbi:MAG: biopolymer transporter ExbD, partial [Fimbriimonas ginsengisoli]|nr:biopolymer transporter ExbD [Fimbriimonas ginsengisoli]
PVNLPKAATSREQNAQTVTITLRADGSTFLNTGRVEIGQLQAKLASLGVTPRTFITINADERVILGRVIAAMDEARKAGVTSFGFATNRR